LRSRSRSSSPSGCSPGDCRTGRPRLPWHVRCRWGYCLVRPYSPVSSRPG
jgi:hypothetical protein